MCTNGNTVFFAKLNSLFHCFFITGVIAALAFVFSFGNVAALAAYLQVPVYIGWLVGPAVWMLVLATVMGVIAVVR